MLLLTQNICLFVQDNIQPIHGAASHGHVHIVQLLIDVYEVDPTVKAKVATYIHIN